jgi:hypothetical protein
MALTRTDAHAVMLSVPGTYEKLYYRRPSIFHGEDFVASVHDQHDAVVVRTGSIEMRDLMLEAEPALFFITDHYKNWPGVLARLDVLDRKTLKALVAGRIAQMAAAPAKKKRAVKAAKKKK